MLFSLSVLSTTLQWRLPLRQMIALRQIRPAVLAAREQSNQTLSQIPRRTIRERAKKWMLQKTKDPKQLEHSLAAGSASSSYCKTIQRGLLSVCSPTDRCSSEADDVMTDPTSAHLNRASSVRPDLAQGHATPCQLPCQAHSR